MLFLAEQTVAARDVETTVGDVEIGKVFAEESERVLAMLFQRIGRDHDEIGVRLQYLGIILLQRSGHAGCSVGMIAVTVLARENEISMPLGELAQRKPAVGGVDEKFGSLRSDSRVCQFRCHGSTNLIQ